VLYVVSWGRCIFRHWALGHRMFVQSKNKARDDTFNSERWALPEVIILKVASALFRVVRHFFKIFAIPL
jgi:hypothetical protein